MNAYPLSRWIDSVDSVLIGSEDHARLLDLHHLKVCTLSQKIRNSRIDLSNLCLKDIGSFKLFFAIGSDVTIKISGQLQGTINCTMHNGSKMLLNAQTLGVTINGSLAIAIDTMSTVIIEDDCQGCLKV